MFGLFIVIIIVGFTIYNYFTRPVVKGVTEYGTDWPLIRNWPGVVKNRKLGFDAFLQLRKEAKSDNIVRYMPSLPPIILTFEPANAVYVLKDNFPNWIKGDFQYTIFQPFLGDGIFAIDGHQWKQQRKVASPLFAVQELRSMIPVFLDHGKLVLKTLEEASKSGKSIDVQELFQKYTMDSITKIAFGVELHNLEKDVPFAAAFDTVVINTSKRVSRMTYKMPSFIKNLDPNEQGITEAVRLIDEFCYDVISKRKQDPKLAERTDLLSRYLTLRDDQGNAFSDVYIRDVLTSFMLAGRDTVSQLLGWTIHNFSTNPLTMEKARQELIDAEVSIDTIDYEDVKKDWPYLKACAEETLRLYPPVPFEAKVAVNDDTLPNGIKIKAGTRVGFSYYAFGRMEEFWGQDCLEYKPERFLDGSSSKVPAGAYTPFLMGPRVCLGQQMALLEGKTMLAMMLLAGFSFKPDPSHKVSLEPSVTIKAKEGIHVFVSKKQM